MDLERARNWAWFCLAIAVGIPLAMVSFKGPPLDSSAERASEIIRSHTMPHEQGAFALHDKARGVDNGYLEAGGTKLPLGWQLFDPFTDQTRHWPNFALLPTARDPIGTRRVLLRSSVEEQSQIFLLAGGADFFRGMLVGRMEEREKHPLRSRWQQVTLSTSDGIQLDLQIHGLGKGLLGGEELLQITGLGRFQGGTIIVDAGGDPERFDVTGAMLLLRSLDLSSLLGE